METVINSSKELRYALLQATRYDVDHARNCYNFVQGPDKETAKNGRPDGIYFVLKTPDGKVAKEYHTQLTEQQKEQCIGIGVQRAGVRFCVSLYEHNEVVLLPDDVQAKKRARYLDRECDALHDFDSETNTRQLIEDNAALGEIIGAGWNIPALGVLVEMCYLRNEINQALEIVGGSQLKDTWYWSSTEYSQNLAWIVNFSNGGVNSNGKYFGYAVRAVAAF